MLTLFIIKISNMTLLDQKNERHKLSLFFSYTLYQILLLSMSLRSNRIFNENAACHCMGIEFHALFQFTAELGWKLTV